VTIYTRGGDAGETGLWGGERVKKNDPRIEACGELDELSASLGYAAAALADDDLLGLLRAIQQDLLAIGAGLAGVRRERVRTPDKLGVTPDRVTELERAIDRAEGALSPLKTFILPGGAESGARLHLARAVCRRAERRVTALTAQAEVPPVLLAYLNRLSDLLFVLARLANQRAGAPEIPW